MMYESFTADKAIIGDTKDGGFFFKMLKFSQSVTLASVAAATTAEQNLTFTGVLSGDLPIALDSSVAAATLGVYPQRCGAANTLTVRCDNSTAAPIVIGAVTAILTVLRPIALTP